ncbi:MAG: SpoIIE family protein phosphatase [Gammaproteobacteria bacterium]|nr:SpoIIE family protein phosphatase [Gammaproteobacteria bacterium]MCP5136691.1 SpoIIE family protein phosphatase [Gammaproteobacteria bacterium]
MQVLLADDSKDMLILTSTVLEKSGYEVITAADGQEAWEILLANPIQMVISDWMMPRMDGLELCRRIRAHDFPKYIYTILLTGRSDRESLVEGMEAGADDFLTKPVNIAELRVRVRAGVRILELESKLEERNRRIEKAHSELSAVYESLENDLRSAASMQASLLPKPMRWRSLETQWVFKPSAFVAGDMFGYFPIDDRRFGFYHLDVSGHGIPSALLSFTLNKVLTPSAEQRNLFTDHVDAEGRIQPSQVVTELNRRFLAQQGSSQYFTMVLGTIDSETGEVELAQAGHPSPLHLHHATSNASMIGEGGFPVGMLPEMAYEDTEFTLAPGDRLVIYSDGITEAENADGAQYGEARLQRLLSDTMNRSLAEVTTELTEQLNIWREERHPDDDITMLIIERHPED